MTNAYDMPHITQAKLQQLVCQYTRRIAEPKQTVIGKHSDQSHRPRMQKSFVTKITEGCVTMNDLNVLANEDLPQDGKGTKYGRESGGAVHNPMR